MSFFVLTRPFYRKLESEGVYKQLALIFFGGVRLLKFLLVT